MNIKLNTKSAFIVVLFYLVLSILVSLIAAIFFGGISSGPSDRIIEGVIDSGLYANMLVTLFLLYISFSVFKDSRKDIFFERKNFQLSKLYYLFPLIAMGIAIFGLVNVDYSSYSPGVILQVIIASLVIGINEEVVTRGILLTGLRHDGLDEWKVFSINLVIFSLLHLINTAGAGNLSVLLVTVASGALYYTSRRVFNNLVVPIALHALHDVAFFLLPGVYAVGDTLPDQVLNIQFGSFLITLAAVIVFLIFGRGLLKNETTGWS